VFDYEGKGSKRRVVVVDDPMLRPVIRNLKRRRSGGDALLAWKTSKGWVDVRSSDINSYIKENAGEQFSAKDFRTWSATVMAAVSFASKPESAGPASSKEVKDVVRQVADAIGDTPAVCRSSYIDPAVLEGLHEGGAASALRRRLWRAAVDSEGLTDTDDLDWLGRLDSASRCAIEASVLKLLDP
jgi:DNA topoisomerase IB